MSTICQLKKSPFLCKNCNFMTSNKKDYTRHLITPKHIKKVKSISNNLFISNIQLNTDKLTIPELNNNEIILTSLYDNKHTCYCGKQYKERSGLWRHKRRCIKLKDKEDSEEKSKIVLDASLNQIEQLTNLVIDMVKQNQELQKQVLELASKPNSIINNNTLNQNNNNFNLSFFLNETCKDAMNLTDFVNSLTLSLKDLENTGTLGYEEGISQIFINGLSQLSIDKRPIHCSDVKREKLYIRDKNIWEKDHEHIKKAVRKVANKNVDQICDWVKINPDSQSYINPNNYNSKKNDQYLNMVSKATGGSTKEEEEKRICKVVSNIAKHVEIDKNT